MKQSTVQKIDPEVENVLASIRQIMSADLKAEKSKNSSDVISFPNVKPVMEKKSTPRNGTDVLVLTEMIANDGSIISLKEKGAEMNAKAEEKQLETSKEAEEKNEAVEVKTPARKDTIELSEDQAIKEKTTEPKIEASKEEIESIMSPDAVLQSTAAFSDLNKLNEHMKNKIQDGTFGTQTVDQLMREMLRPLLKEWLDSHLPSLVKWLVAEKIEQMIKERQEKGL